MTTLRLAFRQLMRSPGFVAVAVLTLALGIGLNTSMFSFLNALMLRPLPFPGSDQLVRLNRVTPENGHGSFSAADFFDLRQEQARIGRFAAYHHASPAVAELGRSVEAIHVSADFFEVLGVQPVLGRSFRPEEEFSGNDRVVLLSHRVWQQDFGGATDVIGKGVRVDGVTCEITGVMSPDATDHRLFGQVQIFRPLGISEAGRADRERKWLQVLGRCDGTLSVLQSSLAVAAVGARLASEFPAQNGESSWVTEALPQSSVSATGKGMLAMLLGLSTFVVLIACSNLANLLLARVMTRTRDAAVRTALGASRRQLLLPLAVESLLLALAGGAGALGVAVWTTRWLQSVITHGGGPAFVFPMDWRVLGFAAGATVLTLVFFSLAPALYLSRLDPNETLKGGARGATPGRGNQRFRQWLIIAQFCFALILLVGAGYFIRGSVNLLNRDHGWSADSVVIGNVLLPEERYPTGETINAFQRQVLERLTALPGIEAASFSYALPYQGFRSSAPFIVEGRERPQKGREPSLQLNGITPGYFGVTRTRRITGRNFQDSDRETGIPVAIINQTMAQIFFPGESAVGRRVALAGDGTPDWMEIVGVVADADPMDVARPGSVPQLYRPMAQAAWHGTLLAVRTTDRATARAMDALRTAVAGADSGVEVRELMTAQSSLEMVSSQMYLCRQLLGVFAVLGLLLAALGIYGVISRLVVQRTGEIGVRMALGARIPDIIRMVLGSGLRLAGIGSLIGLAGVAAFTRLIGSLLPRMETNSVWVTALSTLLLFVIALLACWIPARRAARVEPMMALRSEG